ATPGTLRKIQSSVQKADENHEKVIQAQQIAKLANEKPSNAAMKRPAASASASCDAARLKLVANVRSKSSSSGVATRCASCGLRPPMPRDSWRRELTPESIVKQHNCERGRS